MAINSSIPKAVPSASANSTANSVEVLTEPQLGPYQPMTGSSIVPVVPRTETEGDDEVKPNPGFGGHASMGGPPENGTGAPSVPGMGGILFTPGPIDIHYQDQDQARDPYAKVNNPPTVGRWQWLKGFVNGIATSQDTDLTGFKARHPQQRTSYMRPLLPPHGNFGTESYVPKQQPQAVRYNRIRPTIGTDPYGSGVLNADTFGAGQTAGGIGGNNYTPTPGPPETNSTAGGSSQASAMPTWG